MVVKFLELDSNYRNRNLYPNPADFQVNISQTGLRNSTNALDPVSLSYPVVAFCPNNIPSTGATASNNGLPFYFNGYTGSSGPTGAVINSSSETSFTLLYTYNNSSTYPITTSNGYFVGLMLVLDGQSVQPARRIVSWNFLKDDTANKVQYFSVTIDKAFDYDKTINTPTTGTSCSFKIFNPTDLSVTANSFMFLPNTLSIPNYYNKYIIYNESKKNFSDITSYDMNSHLASISISGGSNWNLSDTYTLRQQTPRVISTVQGVTGTTSISLGFTGDVSYVNNFIAVYPPSTTGFARSPDISQILSVGSSTYFTTAPFSALPSVGSTAEVLGFNYDNVSPFVYTGSISSQSQPSAQDITLNSLILPNVTLENGGRIAYYPYVYVELENISSSSSGTRNLIYSNNPNTYKAVFKVPITDLNHPNQSPFVKLTGNGMKQTMVFKQNDDMRVSIRLPGGELFQTASSDNSEGQAPNPLLQVSVLFGMEKL